MVGVLQQMKQRLAMAKNRGTDTVRTGGPAQSGPLFLLAAAVLFGTAGTSQAFAPHGAEPVVIGTLRLVIGGPVLLALAKTRGAFRTRATWPHKHSR